MSKNKVRIGIVRIGYMEKKENVLCNITKKSKGLIHNHEKAMFD